MARVYLGAATLVVLVVGPRALLPLGMPRVYCCLMLPNPAPAPPLFSGIVFCIAYFFVVYCLLFIVYLLLLSAAPTLPAPRSGVKNATTPFFLAFFSGF